MGIYASVQNPSETLPCKLCHLLRNVRSGWVDAAGCRRGKKTWNFISFSDWHPI